MPPEIDAETLRAYRETEYRVDATPALVLHIGQRAPALAELLRGAGQTGAAYLTASNPRSRQLDAAANAQRQEALAKELDARRLRYRTGSGTHPTGRWPPEASFLVLGIAREEAEDLGRRFEQNAIVWCGADAVPQLVLLR